MAFNIVKGNVQFSGDGQGTIEDMVDDHSNQTIGGTKTFSSMITASQGVSASVYYGDASNLDNLPSAPVSTYNSSSNNRILTSVDSSTIQGEANLTFDGSLLTLAGVLSASLNISGSAFYGDATGLTNIPTDQFFNSISAADLNLGDGVENLSDSLKIKLPANSGLNLTSSGLSLDVNNLAPAPSVADGYKVTVYDGSSTKNTTVQNLGSYIQSNYVALPNGSNGQIQYFSSNEFGSSANLTINSSANVFTTSLSRVHSHTVQTGSYSLSAGDEIVIMNNSSVATASLPTITSNFLGIVFTVKRTGTGAVHISGSDTIDSLSSIDLTPQGSFIQIIAADFGGANYGWTIIAKSGSF
jgi:hypothetical protein